MVPEQSEAGLYLSERKVLSVLQLVLQVSEEQELPVSKYLVLEQSEVLSSVQRLMAASELLFELAPQEVEAMELPAFVRLLLPL